MLKDIFSDLTTRDLTTVAVIRHLELLIIQTDEVPEPFFGCDQDWYHEPWQRQAGCGPCTSASILYYLSCQHQAFSALYPLDGNHQEDFRNFMSEIWHYVTPGRMGVNEGRMLSEGVLKYALTKSVKMHAHLEKIAGLHQKRISFEVMIQFILAGLSSNCPVAFLNLSNGNLDNLESWHWVTIAAVLKHSDPAYTTYYAAISDSGEPKVINLSQWYESSLLGGTFVYFSQS